MIILRYFITNLLLCVTFSASCTSHIDFPKTVMFIGSHEFRTEVANTPERHSHGLMYRTSLADDQAMLFVFPTPRRLSFWMKNTKIPLDILYFNRAGRLLEVKRNLPPCQQAHCPSYPTQTDQAMFAVEVRAGIADTLGEMKNLIMYGCGLL